MEKTTIMASYIALTVALAAVGYKYTDKFIDVTSQIGAILGGITAILISVALWYTVGQKMIGNKNM